MVDEEPLTPVWYAIYFPGTNTFGIVDFFASEAERDAHLAALFASVNELLTGRSRLNDLNAERICW